MRLTALSVLAAVVMTCAASGDVAATRVLTIGGAWVSQCVPLGKNGRHGLIVRLNISPTTVETSGQMYARNICDSPVLSFVDRAAVKRMSRNGANWEVDARLIGATTTVQASEVVALYNAGRQCGLTGWQVGVPMPVAGRTCQPMSFPPEGAKLLLKARFVDGRLTLLSASSLLGASEREGAVLPQDIEFDRANGSAN